MRKGEIIEMVQRRLEGGDYAKTQYTNNDIAHFMEAAFNKLYKAAAVESMSMGIQTPPNSLLFRFEVNGFKVQDSTPLQNDFPTSFYKITLPVSPVNLPNGMGLFKLFPKGTSTNVPNGGHFRELVPIPTGQMFLAQNSILSESFVEQLDRYEWTGGRGVVAAFNGLVPITDDQITFVCYLVANDFAGIGLGDETELPLDMVNDIILATIQMLTGNPEDDSSANFNNKPNR